MAQKGLRSRERHPHFLGKTCSFWDGKSVVGDVSVVFSVVGFRTVFLRRVEKIFSGSEKLFFSSGKIFCAVFVDFGSSPFLDSESIGIDGLAKIYSEKIGIEIDS